MSAIFYSSRLSTVYVLKYIIWLYSEWNSMIQATKNQKFSMFSNVNVKTNTSM